MNIDQLSALDQLPTQESIKLKITALFKMLALFELLFNPLKRLQKKLFHPLMTRLLIISLTEYAK